MQHGIFGYDESNNVTAIFVSKVTTFTRN